MATKLSCVVMDNGSFTSKAGFSHEKSPSFVFPTKVGHPRDKELQKLAALEDTYVGDEAIAKRAVLSMLYPVEHGVIKNWEEMERLWQYSYKKLGVSPEDQPLQLSDAASNTAGNRGKMTEIMMEKFKIPALLIANQGVLALYSEGCATGVVVSSGGVSQVVCIKDGFPVSSSTFELGGRDIDIYLARNLIINGGAEFNYQTFLNDVMKMKELFGYIALDYEEELKTKSTNTSLARTFTLLNEETATLKTERFICPEILFKPSLFEKETQVEIPGLHEACYKNIMACDTEIRKDLFGNIVLSGGSTLFPGLSERLTKELEVLASPDVKINVRASPNRIENVWIGGSIVASQPNFMDSWISQKEYEEHGAYSLVGKKYI